MLLEYGRENVIVYYRKLGKSFRGGSFETEFSVNGHLQVGKGRSRQKFRAKKARYVQRIEA